MIVIRTRQGEVHIIQSAIIKAEQTVYGGAISNIAGRDHVVLASPYKTPHEADKAVDILFRAIEDAAKSGNPIITIDMEALGVVPDAASLRGAE